MVAWTLTPAALPIVDMRNDFVRVGAPVSKTTLFRRYGAHLLALGAR